MMKSCKVLLLCDANSYYARPFPSCLSYLSREKIDSRVTAKGENKKIIERELT